MRRHVLLLDAVETLSSTVTVKRLLYVFCQARGLAIYQQSRCAMEVDDGVVLRPRSVAGEGVFGQESRTTMVLKDDPEYQDFEATATRPANCRVRENESRGPWLLTHCCLVEESDAQGARDS
jgi:hypothetical protein